MFAISYATGALGFNKVSVLIVVTIAAVLMAVAAAAGVGGADRPVRRPSGVFGRRGHLRDRGVPGVRPVRTKNLLWFGLAMVLVFSVVHALFYGAQGTLYSSLYHTGTRYTGLSFAYQFSGVRVRGHPDDPERADHCGRRRAVAGVWVSGGDGGDQSDRHRADPRR